MSSEYNIILICNSCVFHSSFQQVVPSCPPNGSTAISPKSVHHASPTSPSEYYVERHRRGLACKGRHWVLRALSWMRPAKVIAIQGLALLNGTLNKPLQVLFAIYGLYLGHLKSRMPTYIQTYIHKFHLGFKHYLL